MESANGPGVVEPPKKSARQVRQERREAAHIEAVRQRSSQLETIIEFQPDAVEIEKRSVPGGARWTLYTVVLLLMLTVAWSYWAQVDKIVVASGKLVTVTSPVVVQSVTTAPIRTMHVRFGDRVRAGDVLATLDATFPEADLSALQSKLQGLDASLARLTAEKDGVEFSPQAAVENIDWMMEYQVWLERKKQYDAKMNEFASEKNKLDVQMKNNDAEIEMQTENVGIYLELEKKWRELLRKGSMSNVDVLSREIQRRQTQKDLLTSESLRDEMTTEYDALTKRKEAFEAGWRAEVAVELLKKFQERKALQQEIKKATQMSKYVDLKVPNDTGFDEFEVLEVADRSVGSVLQSGEALFKLIPVDAPLEAEIDIEGKDIALIQEGTEVRIKLAAFPYQQHGTLDGTIRTISEDAFEEDSQLGPTIKYRARVQLSDPIKLDKVKNARLSPGMSMIAEVKVGRRRVIQYFLYPIIRAWDTSIREP